MRVVFFLFLLSFIGNSVIGQSNTPDASTWITNGTVNSVVYSNEKVYLGGDFTHVGPMVPFGTVLNSSTGLPNMSYAAPNGAVRSVVPDGSGGWYIGGDFTSVGGVTRNRLARINSDGTLHSWNPNANGGVNTLLISGSTIYVGGNFTAMGVQARNRIAALDASTGSATNWNPSVTGGPVNAIAINGNIVYIGGNFTTVAGTTRERIAALNATADGTAELPYLTSWDPNVDGPVNGVSVSGNTVYIGGSFFTVAGTTRERIAALNATANGTAELPYLTTWNPLVTGGSINAITLDGNTIYIGGFFTTVAGTTRNRIAALDASTGSATSWNPNADFDVNSLLISGTTLYVGGGFSSIGGQSRARIAALNTSDGSATDWNPKAGSVVMALAVNGASVYIGGDFNSIGGEVRNRLARLDAATGQADSWNPNANSTVRAMLISAGKLYVGGSFTSIGVVARNRIAAFNEVDGTLTSFDPNVRNGEVSSLGVSGSTVYLGGTYNGVNSINGNITRNRLAAVDGITGVATTWNPNVSGKVNAIAVHDGKVYFGGQFNENDDPENPNTINGTTVRNYLAAVNVSDGIVTSWDPNTDGEVFAVNVNNGLIYVAGNCVTFTSSGQTITRNRLAALNSVTGVPTDWNPNPNSTISTMAFSGAMVYVGRGFSSIGGSSRQNAAGVFLNLNTSNATSWNPTPGLFVFGIAVGGNKVYLGGSFSVIGGENRRGFAAYSINSVEWGGSSGGNWNDASNWAPGIVPNSSLDVSVSMGSPLLNEDYTLASGKTLTLSGTGTLTVAPGKTLTVAGTANFGGRPVSLKSTSLGTASIGQVTGTISNASNVTVERYVPAGRKWRFLTAPLTGASNNSVFYNWQNNDVPNGARGVEVFGPGGHTDPSSLNTGLALGASASMRYYDAGWKNVINTNTNLLFDGTTNNGYALFLTGPYNNGSTTYIGSTGNLPAGVETTLSATGTLITGDHTKSFTATTAGQYFMVGNPYASSVNPASFTTTGTVNRTNLDNILYMWDAKPGSAVNRGLGRYVSYDIAAGSYSNGGAGTGFIDNTVQIQSGQAFFVRATSIGAASLVFRESNKSSIGSHDMLGNSTQTLGKSMQILLQKDSVHIDGVKAFFHADASPSLDAFDGYKLMNGTDNLGLRRDGKTLVFEHRPELKRTDTLYSSLTQMQAGQFRLRVVLQGITAEEGLKAELLDRHLKQSIPLLLNDTTNLDFIVTADSTSSGERFWIVFTKSASTGNGPLEPVVLRMKPYPNPAVAGIPVRVDLDGKKAPWELRLIDVTGRSVWNETVKDPNQQQIRIDMSRMAAGVYQLLMKDGKGVQTVSRVVKQ